jgi:hypothetical protein
MNRFGEIADELTDLIEELERADLAVDGKGLKLALERAFAKACEAERAQRLRRVADPRAGRPRGRADVRAEAEPVMGVVIRLPSIPRSEPPRLRRLVD